MRCLLATCAWIGCFFLPFALPLARANECLHYGDYVGWGGMFETAGTVNDAAGRGDFVYVTGSEGFQVYDAADPDHPVLQASIKIPGGTGPLALAGTFAYVTAGAELLVIDIADAEAPAIVGRVAIAVTPIDVSASSRRACLRHSQGLTMIDVSKPSEPRVGGRLNAFDMRDCAVYADYVYSVVPGDKTDEYDLWVIDAADVNAPQGVGRIPFHTYITSLVVDESTALLYAAGYQFRVNGCGGEHDSFVRRLDLTSPGQPVIKDQLNIGGNSAIEWLGLGGDILMAAIWEPNLSVDRHLLAYKLTPFPGRAIVRVAITGQPLAVAANSAVIKDHVLQMFKIGDRALAPPEIARAEAGGGSDVLVKDGLAFLAGTQLNPGSTTAELNIFQIMKTGGLNPMGSLQILGESVMDLGLSEEHMLLQTITKLRIVDITDPAHPGVIGVLDTGFGIGSGVWFDATTQHAIIATFTDGVQVADLSNPAKPFIVSTLDLPERQTGITGRGSYAYVTSTFGLRVVDVSAPESPQVVGVLAMLGGAVDAILVDENAVVAKGGAGVEIVDVADPRHPLSIGHVVVPGPAVKLAVQGDVLYVATETDGLAMVSLVDPSAPRFLGSRPEVNEALMAVTTDSQMVYVAQTSEYQDPCGYDGSAGALSILLPECPPQVSPVEVSGFEAAPEEGEIVLSWRIPPHNDVLSFRVYRRGNSSDPFSPLGPEPIQVRGEVYTYRDSTILPGVMYQYRLQVTYLSGDIVYYGPVSATASAAPMVLRLGPASPNPFSNRGPEIRFALPHRDEIQLRVVNVYGRVVKVIFQGILDQGEHVAMWDGRDSNAVQVPAGVYYFELRGVGESRSCKVVKVR